jgi:transaldolase
LSRYLAGCRLETAKASDAQKISLDEKTFRFGFNEDPMAVDKTAEGIRKFSADIIKLEKLIASRV